MRQRFTPRLVVAIAFVSGFGCDAAPKKTKSGSETGQPSVQVDAAEVQLGFSSGRLRAKAKVGSFRISKHPVTKAAFDRCVAAGACVDGDVSLSCSQRPDLALDANDDAETAPALCVGTTQAKAYCKWAGGRLPNLSQWLLAARGPNVQRYPWSADDLTCARHPGLPTRFNVSSPSSRLPDVATAEGRTVCSGLLTIGQHPEGAAPSSMEDVLLTPGELVETTADSPLPGCGATFEACVVYGISSGSIDAAEPVYHFKHEQSGKQMASVTQPYGFRCAWSGEE